MMNVSSARRTRFASIAAGLALTSVLVPIGPSTVAAAPPTFSAVAAPATIGPGSTSRLTFTITNGGAVPATSLAFVDTLPTAVTVAAPANVINTCLGSVAAAPGTQSISLAGGSVGAGVSCSIGVDVTSATPGTHTNTTGDLTSSIGSSGSASNDLTVATDRPGFSKAFSPGSVNLGERSTLTLTIDNSANNSVANLLNFTDTLPSGMVVADPADASTSCGGFPTVTATPGSGVVALSDAGSIAAGAVCTVVVDVVATAGGALDNSSGELLSNFTTSNSSGKANATLTSTVSPLHVTKAFTDDPATPGGTATLHFTITNFDRSETATGVALVDDLDATLSGLVASSLPADPCGTGSTLTGSATITLAGGTLAAGETCTFDVMVDVPAGAPAGRYTNTSGEVSSDSATGNSASDDLFVAAAPVLTKTFVDDVVGAGGTSTLSFTIDNTDLSDEITGVTFEDVFAQEFPSASMVGTTPVTSPFTSVGGLCGPGSTVFFYQLSNSPGSSLPASLDLIDGTIPAGGSCTFSIELDVADGAATGTYTNTTGPVSATVGGAKVIGGTASDDISVVGAPALRTTFTDDPVAPGDAVTLEFTVDNGAGSDDVSGDVDAITFTDDLTFTSGVTALGLPLDDVCGVGSSLTGAAGDTFLTFTGGSLLAGESCTFAVELQTSASTPLGITTNTTSSIDATIAGQAIVGVGASDELIVSNIAFTKSFTDDPVLAGTQVTLDFTMNNAGVDDATGIAFTDDFDETLDGLALDSVASDTCGGTVGGNASHLSYSGGAVTAGSACTLSVVLDVPVGADADRYPNTTSAVTATIDNILVVLPAASDTLVVVDPPTLGLTKQFMNNPVVAGGSATLRFEISNPSEVPVDSITFTDDLDATLTGLAAGGLPITPTGCGGGTLGGTVGNTMLTFVDGSLGAGASCTFDVTLAVPAGATPGSYPNTTSAISGDAGVPVSGPAASATLIVSSPQANRADLSIMKTDDVDPVVSGGALMYTITVTNAGPDQAVGVTVTDTLPAIVVDEATVPLVTLVSTSGCAEDTTAVPDCSLGTIPAGGSASYTIEVSVNGDTDGVITNSASVTSATTDPNLANNSTSEDTTVIADADLSIAKSDRSDPVVAGTSLTYDVTVSNAGPADALDVVATDTLPAGTTLVSTSGCAEDSTGVPTCTLGTIAAGSSATYSITVDVDSSTLGAITNTASVTAANNDPDPGDNSTDEVTTVVAEADLSLVKSDSDDPAPAGAPLIYTIAVTNDGPSDATGVSVAETLPAGVSLLATSGCAEDPTGVPTCTLGTIAAGNTASYTVTVATDPGGGGTSLINSASVSSATPDPDSANNSDTEHTALITVTDMTIVKVDDVDPIRAHADKRLIYTITVTNLGPSNAAGIVVTETLPPGVKFKETIGCAEKKNDGVPTCTLGSLVAGASATYTVEVKMRNDSPRGIMTNTATVSSATNDPDLANNTDTEDTLVCDNVVNGLCVGAGSSLVQSDGSIQASPTGQLPVTGSSGSSSLFALALAALAAGLALLAGTRTRRPT